MRQDLNQCEIHKERNALTDTLLCLDLNNFWEFQTVLYGLVRLYGHIHGHKGN